MYRFTLKNQMLHSSTPNYISVPYNVVLSGQSQPMLGNNEQKKERTPHPKDFEFSKSKGSNYFFYVASRFASLLGILVVVMSIVWVSMILFTDKSIRNVYQTTAFTTTVDRDNADAWQVLAMSWSDLSKPNPTTDVQFDHYYECWWAAGVRNDLCPNTTVNDYKQCINAKFSTQMTTCLGSNDPTQIVLSMNDYTRCINTAMQPTRQSMNALKICLRTDMWPLYEYAETVDTWVFLGSFNWAVFLTIGFALFSCFVMYTGGFVMNSEALDVTKPGEPAKNGPLSYTVTMACAIFSLLFFIYFLVNAYRLPNTSVMGSSYPFPNSVATNTIMIPATLIVFIYFVMELLQMWDPPEFLKKYGLGLPTVGFGPNGQLLQAHNMPNRYGYIHDTNANTIPIQNHKDWKYTLTAYYPALTLTWADAYLLDPVIAIGLLGATHQCTSTTLYQVFLALFTYRLAHTSVARFMYEGYIYNPDESNEKFSNSGTPRKELYAIRMQAMFMHLSALCALIMAYNILTNPYLVVSEFLMVYTMIYLWFVVPEIIRLIAHIIVAFKALSAPDKNVLLIANYFVWIWDVIVRFVYICIIIWGANNIAGSQNYLDTRLQNITNTILYMNS